MNKVVVVDSKETSQFEVSLEVGSKIVRVQFQTNPKDKDDIKVSFDQGASWTPVAIVQAALGAFIDRFPFVIAQE